MEKSLNNELPSDALTAQCRAIRSKSCNTMKFGHLYFTIRSGWNSCHVPVRDVINRSPELMQRLKTNCFGENDTYDMFSHFTESHPPHTNPNAMMTLKGQFGHKTPLHLPLFPPSLSLLYSSSCLCRLIYVTRVKTIPLREEGRSWGREMPLTSLLSVSVFRGCVKVDIGDGWQLKTACWADLFGQQQIGHDLWLQREMLNVYCV